MKRTLLLAIVISLCAGSALFAGRRRAVALPPQDELTIEFVAVAASTYGDVIDLGVITHPGRHDRRRTIVRQLFGVRLTRLPQVSGGTAVLRASLKTDDPRCTVTVDGIRLGAAMAMIDPRVPLGVVTTHRLEIEVPDSVPEGPLMSGIRWEATTN